MILGVKGRPDLYVVARFLDALAEQEKSRSQLQRAVGVNYNIFQRYEDLLRAKGHIDLQGGSLHLTDKGRALRQELAGWLQRLFSPD